MGKLRCTDPVRNWLESLKWDGKRRILAWLTDVAVARLRIDGGGHG